ncbi:MAG TPA: hypothetical protein VJ725_08580 [Thermoanaerobaculia bacterium]|nr:hypothetical protein [Thermoanaerobaculia bacterium]
MSSSAPLPLRETAAPEPAPTDERASASPAWGPVKRFFLRFGFVYFLLLMVPFDVGVLPFGRTILRPYEVFWESVGTTAGRQVFGVDFEVVETGSGDTTFDYVKTFCHLVLAVLLGLLWTILDRKQTRDPRLYEWFRVYLRLSLALAMIVYGTMKLIPTQFGTLGYYRLLQPFGNASPMGLLWTFMAASPAYTAFTGAIETLGGLLLIPRRTTLLGALVSAGALLQVVMLNFCYDVPVKLFSSHLLVMALVLAAPDLRRLADLFLFNRRVEPVEMRPLFASRRLGRVAGALWGIGFAAITASWLYGAYQSNKQYGFLAPKPPLHGVWEVEEMIVDGKVRPPLLTDEERWRRVVVEEAGYFGIQRMKDSRAGFYGFEQDSARKTFTLQDQRDLKKKYVLSYQRPKPEILVMEGSFKDQQIRVRIRRFDDSEFLLTSRGFHWINEQPFNR